jgi:hypothetical protein
MKDTNLLSDDFEIMWNNMSNTFGIISKHIPFGGNSFFKTRSGIRILFRLINLFERNRLAKKYP